jgi:hypothetical protein
LRLGTSRKGIAENPLTFRIGGEEVFWSVNGGPPRVTASKIQATGFWLTLQVIVLTLMGIV